MLLEQFYQDREKKRIEAQKKALEEKPEDKERAKENYFQQKLRKLFEQQEDMVKLQNLIREIYTTGPAKNVSETMHEVRVPRALPDIFFEGMDPQLF